MLTKELEHQLIKTNGVTLHVVQAGPKDGPLAILLHGFPEFWYGWEKQIEALTAAGYRIWMPDQRGYNLSEKPVRVEDYGLDKLAADVIGLIDAAGKEKVLLVGHDWGGAVAWWTATRYPERLEKLVILNVPYPAILAKAARSGNVNQLLKSWYIGFFQIPFLPETLIGLGNWNGAVTSLKNSSRPGTFSETDLQQYRKAWSQPGAMKAMINWYRAFVRAAPRFPARPRITIPTLVIWGVKDVALGRELAQPTIDLCDNGKLVFIEEASHWVQHEEPEKVNQLILDFWGAANPI